MLIQPTKMIVLGFFLVVFGFIGPFLMVLRVVDSSFWLSFLSYTASISGLILGVLGSALYVSRRRKSH